MSIGIERQLSPNWTLQADYVHWRIYHEWIRVDQNLTFDPVTGYNVNPSAGRPAPAERRTPQPSPRRLGGGGPLPHCRGSPCGGRAR